MSMSHEDLCKRCGECCRVKVVMEDGDMIPVNLYCPCYDAETHRCTVYHCRHEASVQNARGAQCLTISEMLSQGLLPTACAYAPEGYSGVSYDPERAKRVPQGFIVRQKLRNAVASIRLAGFK